LDQQHNASGLTGSPGTHLYAVGGSRDVTDQRTKQQEVSGVYRKGDQDKERSER